MKKVLSLFIALIALSGVQAQCGKKVHYTSSKFQMVDSAGNVGNTREAEVLIEHSTDSIRLSYNGDPNSVMEGAVKNLVCNWKEAYKNGKTSFTTDLINSQGESKHASFTVEAVNGKIVILGKADEEPNRIIRVEVEKYTEK